MFGRRKFGNRKVVTEEGTFDSKLEYQRYLELKELERQGAIFELSRQFVFELIPKVRLDGRYRPATRYIADFVYVVRGVEATWELVVEDAKGLPTPEYQLKRKLMRHVHGIEVREVKKDKKR